MYCEGSVCELIDHDEISNEELLELDVDILIPAALEGVIGPWNVDRIHAPIIVEVANGPSSGLWTSSSPTPASWWSLTSLPTQVA